MLSGMPKNADSRPPFRMEKAAEDL